MTVPLAVPRSFNGATPSQTWKRRFNPTRTPVTFALQWSHAFSDVETNARGGTPYEPPGFNGATPSQTWKPSNRPLCPVSGMQASMEPRLLRRGNRGVAAAGQCVCVRFNGATPSQTWKPCCHPRHLSLSAASMEPRLLRRGNEVPHLASEPVNLASMEPRLLRRGNTEIAVTTGDRILSFNGATPSQTWKPV